MNCSFSARFPHYGLLLLVTCLLTGGGCQKGAEPTVKVSETALPSAADLQRMIDDEVIYTLHQRDLNGEVNAAWQILHGVLAYGRTFEIVLGPKRVQALDWAFAGGPMKGWVMKKDPDQPGLTAVVEQGSKTGQGHPDQWLAIIAQVGVPSDQPLVVAGGSYTVGDLVKQAMYEIYDGKEASWTLISLANYLPLDSEWPAADGTTWNIERIIAMEAAADVVTAACGGTHRLGALAIVLKQYQEANPGVKLTRGWKAARDRLDECAAYVKAHQLPSGAFSAGFFGESAEAAEISQDLHATGHTLEFLCLSLSDEELKQPWVTRSVVYLTKKFKNTRSVTNLECGALYHAARALRLYRERVYGPIDYFHPPHVDQPTAKAEKEVAAAK